MEALLNRSCDYERLEAHVERIRISDLFPADRGLSVRDREFDLSVVAEGIRGRDAVRALFPALTRDRPPFFSRGILFGQRRWGDRHLTPVDGLLRAPSARHCFPAGTASLAWPSPPRGLGSTWPVPISI